MSLSGAPDQSDFILRQITQNIATQQRAIDDITRKIQGFNPEQIAAFDLAGIPSCWETLTRRAGSWPGINSSVLPPFPFQVKFRVNPDNPSLYQAMVNPDSTLMLSMKPNDNLVITGLGTWFDFIANDVISLYIVVADYVATSATIQSYGMGTTTFDPTLAAWNASDNSYVFDDAGTPPKQIGINILIAYSTPDSLGKPYLVQAQFTHLLIENCQIGGRPAIYDFSHRERYGITAP